MARPLIEPFPDATTEKACELHGLVLVKSGLGEFLEWALAHAGVIPNPISSAAKCAVAISAELPPRSLAYFHAKNSPINRIKRQAQILRFLRWVANMV